MGRATGFTVFTWLEGTGSGDSAAAEPLPMNTMVGNANMTSAQMILKFGSVMRDLSDVACGGGPGGNDPLDNHTVMQCAQTSKLFSRMGAYLKSDVRTWLTFSQLFKLGLTSEEIVR